MDTDLEATGASLRLAMHPPPRSAHGVRANLGRYVANLIELWTPPLSRPDRFILDPAVVARPDAVTSEEFRFRYDHLPASGTEPKQAIITFHDRHPRGGRPR